jgi:trigger factor
MQVSVEATGALERRLTITVDDARINEAVQQRLKKLSQTVKMNGFRAGKVPFQIVQQQYGLQVRQEVIGDVVQSSYLEAVQKEKLRPASYPNIETKTIKPGEGLTYVATFEVYPELAAVKCEAVTVERPLVSINDQDLNTMIETIRQQHHTWETVARAAQEGDRVVMDFNGMSEGKPIAGGQGKAYPVEIGKGRMIKGFEEGLIAMQANEEKELALHFPENYHAKELAGKPATFQVRVIAVEESVPPKDDAELATRLGMADSSVEKMREEIRQNMQRELDIAVQAKIKQTVMDALFQANPLDIPNALIEDESKQLSEQMANNLIRQGMPQDQVKLSPAVFTEQAKRRVGLGLILAEIIKQQGIQAEASRVRAKVDAIAAPYERPQEVVAWYYGDKQRLNEVESLVLEEQVVAWVLSQAKVVDKTMTFSEIMNKQK